METPATEKVAKIIEGERKKLEKDKCFAHYEILRESRDVTSIFVLPETRVAIEISQNNPAKAVEILEAVSKIVSEQNEHAAQ